MCFANIFSYSVGYLLILLTVTFEEQKFCFGEVQFIHF